VPKAREFDRWVRHDVLVEIDKTGSYRGTYDGAVIYQQISQLVAPMQADIRELKCDVAYIKSDVTELKGFVGLALKRNKHLLFSETKVLRPVRHFVWEKHEGKCVNCGKVQILDGPDKPIIGVWEADHWSGNQNNKIENCYPVDKTCNLELCKPDVRAKANPRFIVFQEDLHRWLPGYRERLRCAAERAEADASQQLRFDLHQPGYADTSSMSVKFYRGFGA
jgi:hypothetical protein